MNINSTTEQYDRSAGSGDLWNLCQLLLLLLLTLTGCAPVMYDASFSGKVVDIDTGEPIKGAVVLAIWTTWMMTPAGDVDEYYDCYEEVTDQNGEFFIPGKGTRILSNLNPMTVNVIKVGYQGSSGTLESYSRYQKAQNNRMVIPLIKLTPKQKKFGIHIGDPPDGAPLKKVRNFLVELDKYDIERGLPRRRIWNGEAIYEKNN